MSMKRAFFPVFLVTLMLGAVPSASACSVCFGAKDDPVVQAISQSILFMLGLVGLVLLAIVVFFARIIIRSARTPLPDEEVLAIVQPKSTALPS